MTDIDRVTARFKWWQLALGLVHLISGGLVIIYCASFPKHDKKSWPIDVSVTYSVWVAPKDRSCGETDAGCVIFKQDKFFSKFDLGYVTGCFSLISGLHHFLVFFALQWPEQRLGPFYRRCLETSIFPWRWIDYAVTSGLMFAVTGGLFESPASLDLILFCFCFQFVVVVAGAGSECAWSATTGKDGLKLFDGDVKENIHNKYNEAIAIGPGGIYPPKVNAKEVEGAIGTYVANCFYYVFIISWLSFVSVAFNLLVSLVESILYAFEIISGAEFKNVRQALEPAKFDIFKLRLLTYRQTRTMWSTTAGLIFSSTFSVYILIYCLFIYKFYLGVTAEDPKGADEFNVDECGQRMPKGINKPNDAVWIAILSIAITFTTFPVCHMNKIALTRAEDLYSTIKYETIYGFLSFTSKLILLFNIFAGIVMRGDSGIKPSDYRNPVNISAFEQEITKPKDDDGLSASFISILAVIPTCLILGIVSYYNILLAVPAVAEPNTPKQEFKGAVASVVNSVVAKLMF